MPTRPVDHACPAAHLTAWTTSACSPGPAQSRQPFEPPKPRRSTITNEYPLLSRRDPSTKSWKRSEGPAFGPTGSYCVPSAGPPGPGWPGWVKDGPVGMIVGGFGGGGAPLGGGAAGWRGPPPAGGGPGRGPGGSGCAPPGGP